MNSEKAIVKDVNEVRVGFLGPVVSNLLNGFRSPLSPALVWADDDVDVCFVRNSTCWALVGEVRIVSVRNVTCGTDIMDVFHNSGPSVPVFYQDVCKAFPVYCGQSVLSPFILCRKIFEEFGSSVCFMNFVLELAGGALSMEEELTWSGWEGRNRQTIYCMSAIVLTGGAICFAVQLGWQW